MPIVPCSVCADPRPVSKGTATVTCHPCRRDRLAIEKAARPVRPPGALKTTCADCGAEKRTHKHSLPQGEYRCRECRKRDPRCNSNAEYRRRYNADYYQRNKARKRSRVHAARARRYGVRFETVIDTEIFERDRWRCGLCGERVNKNLAAPHILCASIDHIVPLSRGGEHTKANAQCAHWICNSIKNNRGDGGEQLALIG